MLETTFTIFPSLTPAAFARTFAFSFASLTASWVASFSSFLVNSSENVKLTPPTRFAPSLVAVSIT